MLFELAEEIVNRLSRKKMTLSLAESCTGGMASQWITAVSGSSNVYNGGVIAYTNTIKSKVLKVSTDTIKTQGAVSSEVAMTMADGVRKVCGSSIGAAITGIAGPSGGTDEKPVGTVYIAVSTENTTTFKLLQLRGDRNEIRTNSTKQLFVMLKEVIDNM